MTNRLFSRYVSVLLAAAFIIVSGALYTYPNSVSAQLDQSSGANNVGPTFTQMAPLPLGSNLNDPNPSAQVAVGDYLRNGFTFAIAFAGLLAVIRIVWAGILIMSTDAIYKRSEGKEIIRGAVYGLILAIGAYVILSTVSPSLTTLNFNPNQGQANSAGNTLRASQQGLFTPDPPPPAPQSGTGG